MRTFRRRVVKSARSPLLRPLKSDTFNDPVRESVQVDPKGKPPPRWCFEHMMRTFHDPVGKSVNFWAFGQDGVPRLRLSNPRRV